jgi:hypothetical protein
MSGMADRKAKRKDSLAELENFIDSYSNSDTDQGNEDAHQMVNVLRYSEIRDGQIKVL